MASMLAAGLLGILLCSGASAQQSQVGLQEATRILGDSMPPGAGAESLSKGADDAQRALQGEVSMRASAVYAGERGEKGKEFKASGFSDSLRKGLKLSEPPVPGEKPKREAGTGAEFLTGGILAAASMALIFLTPFAMPIKIASAVAGAAIGVVAALRAEKSMTGNRTVDAIAMGLQLGGMGFWAPPAVALIGGALLATPILQLWDKIRGR